VDDPLFFEGSLPVSGWAARGRDALSIGPRAQSGCAIRAPGAPHSVEQLRHDNCRTHYNVVGSSLTCAMPISSACSPDTLAGARGFSR